MEKVEKEFTSRRDKGLVLMRSIMDFGMGILWVCMGFFLTCVKYFNPSLSLRFDDPALKVFGFVCILYGTFRMYRGYKKKYWTER